MSNRDAALFYFLLFQEDAALGDFLSSNVVNPVSFQLARGDPLYTNYTAKFRDVIDYILCDSQSTVS